MTILHEIQCAPTPHAPATLFRLIDVGEDQLIVQARVDCGGECGPMSLIIAQVTKDRAEPCIAIPRPLVMSAVRTICRLVAIWQQLSFDSLKEEKRS